MFMLRVKEVRKEKGFTQQELAQKLNIPQQEISRIEKEKNNVTVKNLLKVALALNVSVDELIDYKVAKKELYN